MIEAAGPANLAFNGKNVGAAGARPPVDYGRQPETLGGARLWVLPSTSGAARASWDIGPWRELAGHAPPGLGPDGQLMEAPRFELGSADAGRGCLQV